MRIESKYSPYLSHDEKLELDKLTDEVETAVEKRAKWLDRKLIEKSPVKLGDIVYGFNVNCLTVFVKELEKDIPSYTVIGIRRSEGKKPYKEDMSFNIIYHLRANFGDSSCYYSDAYYFPDKVGELCFTKRQWYEKYEEYLSNKNQSLFSELAYVQSLLQGVI